MNAGNEGKRRLSVIGVSNDAVGLVLATRPEGLRIRFAKNVVGLWVKGLERSDLF